MPVLIVGGLLAALGIGAALLMVAAALGVAGAVAGATLWVLFPLCTLAGYFLLVVGSRDPAARAPTAWVSGALLLLAAACAVVLVGYGAGLLAVGGAAAVWYVLALAGLFGATGSAAASRATGPDASQGA